MTERLTYVGHGDVVLELGGARIACDPVRRRSLLLGAIRRFGADPPPAETERLDAVLISHLHADHLDFPTLKALPGEFDLIAPAGSAGLFRRHGLAPAFQLEPGETARAGGVSVTATAAAHNGRRWKAGPHKPALGYVIEGAGRRIYFAGDTDLFDGMREIGAAGLDVALLPIGGWGPKISAGHLDPRRAAEAAAMLRPRIVVPIHWGAFLRFDIARRPERYIEPPAEEFRRAMAELAPDTLVHVLRPGESLAL